MMIDNLEKMSYKVMEWFNNVLHMLPTGYGWVEDVARRLEKKTDYQSTGKEIEKDHPFILAYSVT